MPTQVKPNPPPQPRPRQPPPPPEDRDSKKLNDHVKITFPYILGEPEGNHSCDFVWECSEICFTCFRNLCYGTFTLLFGCWIAAYWGCCFACIAFDHIWLFTPFRLIVTYIIWFCRPVKPIIDCCIKPWTGSCGHFFVLFAKPGADLYAWTKPDIKTPIKKFKPPPESPKKVKKETKAPPPPVANMYLGEKGNMTKSIQRQLML